MGWDPHVFDLSTLTDCFLLQDLKLNSNQLSGPVPLTWAGMESLSTM